jgi:hypothetical protein
LSGAVRVGVFRVRFQARDPYELIVGAVDFHSGELEHKGYVGTTRCRDFEHHEKNTETLKVLGRQFRIHIANIGHRTCWPTLERSGVKRDGVWYFLRSLHLCGISFRRREVETAEWFRGSSAAPSVRPRCDFES